MNYFLVKEILFAANGDVVDVRINGDNNSANASGNKLNLRHSNLTWMLYHPSYWGQLGH